MPHYAKKVDRNQAEIIAALRAIPGVSVQPLHKVGGGVPDILVGFRSMNLLLEIKHPDKFRLKDHGMTPAQIDWHRFWTGEVAIITTPEQALALLGLSRFS